MTEVDNPDQDSGEGNENEDDRNCGRCGRIAPEGTVIIPSNGEHCLQCGSYLPKSYREVI